MSVSNEGQEKRFEDTPTGNAQRWAMELGAAKKALESWHILGDKIEKRYLDERDGASTDESRLTLFTANINTVKAIMYGKTPTVTVTRKFNDSDDDVARVAGEMAERMLNEDIQKPSDGYTEALQHALGDFQLTGAGSCRALYSAEFETTPAVPAQTHPETGLELAPEVPETEAVASEEVETLYTHWKDQLWSPARVFEEVRWWGSQAQMSRDELVKRFGEVGKSVPLNAKRGTSGDELDSRKADPWARANVWEIWSKEDKKVYWWVEGYHQTLDVKEDPLELDGFWPFPKPMFANLTNSKFVPRPSYALEQDLHVEIDALTTRINLLVDAVAVKGVYDKTSTAVQRLLGEGKRNELIGVENWAMFASSGGIKGAVDWFPLDMVVGALDKLRETRIEAMRLLDQVSGMSDAVRGQTAQGGTTATEQSIKAKFSSVRLQAMQDEFARFASELQAIRFEIICKHFKPETIIERSNVMRTPDAQLAQQAVQLLKDKHACYRVQVKPENISLTDYAAVKQERTEVIGAIAQYMQMAGPVAMTAPALAPMMLKLLQWLVSGLKGASEIEGVIDQAVSQATQAQQQAQSQPPAPPPPDPKMQAIQAKGQIDAHLKQMDMQHDVARIQTEAQANVQTQAAQAHFNIQESDAKMRHQAVAEVAKTLGTNGTPVGGGGP